MKELRSSGAPGSAKGPLEMSAAMQIHDTINQTLFSVLLIAEVLPNIYERDPREGRARLDELRALAKGAMKDMNTLFQEIEAAGGSTNQIVEEMHVHHRGTRARGEDPRLAR